MKKQIVKTVGSKKRCSLCKDILPVTAFYKNASKGDGLSHHCKVCHKILMNRNKTIHEDKILDKVLAKTVLSEPESKAATRPVIKTCSRCGQTKPLALFPPIDHSTTYQTWVCIACGKTSGSQTNLAQDYKTPVVSKECSANKNEKELVVMCQLLLGSIPSEIQKEIVRDFIKVIRDAKPFLQTKYLNVLEQMLPALSLPSILELFRASVVTLRKE